MSAGLQEPKTETGTILLPVRRHQPRNPQRHLLTLPSLCPNLSPSLLPTSSLSLLQHPGESGIAESHRPRAKISVLDTVLNLSDWESFSVSKAFLSRKADGLINSRGQEEGLRLLSSYPSVGKEQRGEVVTLNHERPVAEENSVPVAGLA